MEGLRTGELVHWLEVARDRSWAEQADNHDTELGGILGAVVVDETVAHWKEGVVDSCIAVARPDLPDLEAVHVHRKALVGVDHSDLADHLDLLQGLVHLVRRVQMLGRRLPARRPGGKGIAG